MAVGVAAAQAPAAGACAELAMLLDGGRAGADFAAVRADGDGAFETKHVPASSFFTRTNPDIATPLMPLKANAVCIFPDISRAQCAATRNGSSQDSSGNVSPVVVASGSQVAFRHGAAARPALFRM